MGDQINYDDDLVARTTAAYEATADAYIAQHGFSDEVYKQADYFLELLEGKARRDGTPVILDAGCGPGRDAEYFAQRDCAVFGIDLVPAFIEEAKKRVLGTFVVGDMRALPFESHSFDGIWNCTALMHLPDPTKALKEHHRVLRRGGLLYVSVLNQPEDSLLTGEQYGDGAKFFKAYTQESLTDTITGAGFEIIEVWESIGMQPRGELTFLNVYARKQ